MVQCKVCGTDFDLHIGNHYISRDKQKTGLTATISGQEEPILFDTFDCPNCGSQFVAQERKYIYKGNIEEPNEACKGCLTCKYTSKEEDEYPCNMCSHAYSDKYSPEEKDE